MKTKILIAIAFIAAALAISGAYYYPVSTPNFSVGAVGDTQSTPKISQVVGNCSSASYVSGTGVTGQYLVATLPNGDANDRTIIGIDAFYSGLGQTSTTTGGSLINVAGATSSNATSLGGNTNYAYLGTVATSTGIAYEASSTPGLSTNAFVRVWKAGSNLNLVANATTSASCWYRVSYLAQ